MSKPVVRLAFNWISKGVVRFLQGGELSVGARVVVVVRMVLRNLIPKRIPDFIFGGVGGQLEEGVEVVSHTGNSA